jgi:hypothetical protein
MEQLLWKFEDVKRFTTHPDAPLWAVDRLIKLFQTRPAKYSYYWMIKRLSPTRPSFWQNWSRKEYLHLLEHLAPLESILVSSDNPGRVEIS